MSKSMHIHTRGQRKHTHAQAWVTEDAVGQQELKEQFPWFPDQRAQLYPGTSSGIDNKLTLALIECVVCRFLRKLVRQATSSYLLSHLPAASLSPPPPPPFRPIALPPPPPLPHPPWAAPSPTQA